MTSNIRKLKRLVGKSSLNLLIGILTVLLSLLSPGLSHAATSEEKAKSYFEEGVELNKQKQYDEAIEKLTQAVRWSLETHKYHQALFMTYLVTRRGLKAVEVYKGLVREFPKSPVVHYWLGRLYLQSRSLDDAAREFGEATRLALKDDHGWISLGHVYYAQGKDEAATKAYLEANRLAPKVAVVHSGLGNLYLKKNDYPKAQKEFSEALKIDPDRWDAHANRGMVLDHMERYAEAAAAYEKALRLNPSNAGLRKLLENARKAAGHDF